VPTGQVWYLSASGGYFANPKLSMNLHTVSQPRLRFRQFTDRKDDFGKSEGDILDFNKVFNVRTRGGRLTEGVPIQKTSIRIGRGQCIATEYGNAIPWTSKYETLSQFDGVDPLTNALTNDQGKVVDEEVKIQFANSRIKYIARGTPTQPTATWDTAPTFDASTGEYVTSVAAQRHIQLWDLKNCVDALKKGVYGGARGSQVPTYDGMDYVCVGSVDFVRKIKDDPDFEEAAKYGDPDRLWDGEAGRIYGCRIVEENHLLEYLGTTSYGGQAFVFGAETVKEIRVIPEEIRRAIPGDYGRAKGMAWYGILGWKIIWEFNATTEPDGRIIHITSS